VCAASSEEDADGDEDEPAKRRGEAPVEDVNEDTDTTLVGSDNESALEPLPTSRLLRKSVSFANLDCSIHFQFFEAEGFGPPCTAWAGSGLLVKSRLIRIRADEGARERPRTYKMVRSLRWSFCLLRRGVTFP
jgi:hypothetical protein